MTPQVLIYSRDPDFILVFGHILRAGGFEPLIISSKDDLPRGDAPAFAAVLDCQVGDKNIAAICADLKKEPRTKATPIAALVAPNAAALSRWASVARAGGFRHRADRGVCTVARA